MTNTKWALDPAHSSVEFSVRHMMFAKVNGAFNSFTASIEANPTDLTSASIEFNVDLSSVDTRNADRDNHLRSGDFFDVENYPSMSFKSTNVVKSEEGVYDVTGDLSIRGVTRPETFVVTFEGQGKDPWGNEKVGFSAEGIFGEFVHNGIEGYNLFKADNWDLLIIDWMLPGMDGVSLCRKIRQENDSIPIIMLTQRIVNPTKC